ncbi:ATP-binding sensor histidine kinase [Caballeronia insecticola]|uniref:histidine kinase n=1 Tax=Caballeronia insecticola TaxID=758793 RepID=R4X5H7_9BURK|nr:ATP-binding sensor histidine kinase [Caballeronia insecticola]BAN28252.1 nodulation protein NodV [Caballeronia insecticola]
MGSNLEVLTQDGDHVFFRTERESAGGRLTTVLGMRPAREPPTAHILKRMSHEFGLRDSLDRSWAVMPLELAWQGEATTLFFEDFSGKPLDNLLVKPFKPDHFLEVAIGIASAVSKLHQSGLVHKDLKPAHILVNTTDKSVRLRGLGLATLNPRERQPFVPPETIDGTLAYMAPEQTGHMNRSVDTRSDLYSLGIVFYQMLTGVLPFAADEPMEWVHCHVARNPIPLEKHIDVPSQIARIVQKLLAKAAEDRYQTAAGLERDLRRCHVGAYSPFDIETFPLGARDTPSRLFIPEKLYGRETDLRTLHAAFDHVVSAGSPKLVLVSGYSGIGKSSVVNELHKSLVPPRGLFASGKFDEYKRGIPYATIAQALQSLISQLLGKSDDEMSRWRTALQDAVGQNGQLMTTIVPNLAVIMGEQPVPPEVPSQDQQARFQMVLRRFLGVFARPEHPLTLFLDDLQWLDTGTLDLIEHLITHADVRHLLIVGAYRDNEVGPGHPLETRLARLRRLGDGVKEIELAPLRKVDITRLLMDTLHMPSGAVASLAALIFEKTAGNPFFSIQFVTALAEQGLLAFDADTSIWKWDLPGLRGQGFTDNVADLMAAKLRRLPLATRRALGELACLGSVVSTLDFALTQSQPETDWRAALSVAVRAGLLHESPETYTFLHDRIREAAYALIPEDARASTHLTMGRALATRATAESLRESIFEIVNQFGHGVQLISEPSEREQVARLELIAGDRAKASAAYETAAQYYATGRALLPERAWENCYPLVFDLELNEAESLYLAGEMSLAETKLAALVPRARTLVDAAAVACARINLFTILDQSGHAVAAGLEYLRQTGENWSSAPTADDVANAYGDIWKQIEQQPIEALSGLPFMQSEERSATMNVLTVLTTPALFTNSNLFRLTVVRMATLSFAYGNTHGSSLAYAWLGSILGSYFNDYQAGFRFGALGLNLVDRLGLDRFRARVYLVFGVHIAHWSRPLDLSLGYIRQAFDAAMRTGDISFASYACADSLAHRIARSDALEEVEQEAERNLEFARRAQFGFIVDVIHAQRALVRFLRGSAKDARMIEAEFNESGFEQRAKDQPQLALPACYYWIRRLQGSVFAGDIPSAIRSIRRIRPVLWTTPTQFEHAEYYFYGALAWAMRCEQVAPDRARRCVARLLAHHAQLLRWVEHCPTTFASRVALTTAEIARAQGRGLDVLQLYEEAIARAGRDRLLYVEALAYERAAGFCLKQGLHTVAQAYLHSATECYLRWGAHGKARQLLEHVIRRPDGLAMHDSTSTIQTSIEHLDLATVLKVSQAVSREMISGRLIDVLLRTVMERAGAERSVLVLEQGQEQRIVADATIDNGRVRINQNDRPVTSKELPLSVLLTVTRLRETMVVRDARADLSLAGDPYLRDSGSRSILCLPMINQGKLLGFLYLENNHVQDIFTSAQIGILRFLASQAAVALDNSRLYLDLARREAKIRRLVDANIVGVTFWHRDGLIIDANDAFLRIVGYDRDDLCAGRLNWQTLTPDQHVEHIGAWTTAGSADSGQAGAYEKEYIRKDGSRAPVLVVFAGAKEESDEGISFVLDLTDRKRNEEALRMMRIGLEHGNRVAMMGQLAASVAHEVKQPMTGLMNNANLLLRQLEHENPELSKLRKTASRIVRDTRRASDVIDRTSALVHKTTPPKELLDLNDVIRVVTRFVRAEAIRQSIQLNLHLADPLPGVYGDRIQLQQLVLNLMMNSIEAVSNIVGRVRTLWIESRVDRAGFVCGVVRDNGPGIPVEDMEPIFDAFHTSKASGMGMGLAICRSIVEAHGGHLTAGSNAWVESGAQSSELCGAVFCFSLPPATRET